MSIITTFNGLNIISLPCDTIPGVLNLSSIEWDRQEAVAVSTSPFTGQTQIYDWGTSWWEAQVSFPPMDRYSADMWNAFIAQCRGVSNAFLLGDPRAILPKGSAIGTPVVSGAGQTGYTLLTRGWVASQTAILLPGDYIQIGYRLYIVMDAANSDGSGNAALQVWPNLRDQPADGVAIKTRQCKGLFRLTQNSGNRSSVNVGAYGFSGIAIRECI